MYQSGAHNPLSKSMFLWRQGSIITGFQNSISQRIKLIRPLPLSFPGLVLPRATVQRIVASSHRRRSQWQSALQPIKTSFAQAVELPGYEMWSDAQFAQQMEGRLHVSTFDFPFNLAPIADVVFEFRGTGRPRFDSALCGLLEYKSNDR